MFEVLEKVFFCLFVCFNILEFKGEKPNLAREGQESWLHLVIWHPG